MSREIISGILFLPIIGYLGFVTSIEDFFSSEIRNKWVLFGLLYAFSVYLLSWILYWLALEKILNPVIGDITLYLLWNFDKWCVNLVVSSLIAYGLWHFKMWGAGDAKLFIAYSALIPMGQYSRVYFNYYFASFLLLLAIFIPATIFLFLRSVVYFIKRFDFSKIRGQIAKLLKERLVKFNKIETGKLLLGFFVLFLFFRILKQEFQNFMIKILPEQNVLMLVSLLAFRGFSKIFKKNFKFVIAAFIILMMYSAFKILGSGSQFIPLEKTAGFGPVGNPALRDAISIGLKKQGSLSGFIFEMANIFARSILVMMLFPIFGKLINLYEERAVLKTIPFAYWMFLGALITWFF